MSKNYNISVDELAKAGGPRDPAVGFVPGADDQVARAIFRVGAALAERLEALISAVEKG